MQRNASRAASALCLSLLLTAQGEYPAFAASPQDSLQTTTPIKHVVVIFGENESFDHYFGTYPTATNPPGEPVFTAAPNTPSVQGLTPALLTNNPNLNSANGTGATNPFRLDRSQAHTSSQNHSYGPEQAAFDGGKMDLFPKNTGAAGTGGTGVFNTKGLVMGYYDGNTVTALWNYAQHFALSDNSYSSTFGPSSPGAVNLISGQTNGAVGFAPSNGSNPSNTINNIVADGQGGFTMFGDSDPHGDVCSSTTSPTTEMTGKNIGDLLNAKNISWGWFEGGFNLQAINANGTTGCQRSTSSPTVGSNVNDYVPHHQPFQYYPSTRNLSHTRPTSVASIGTSFDGGANHQYDTNDFVAAVQAGNLPSVSFLKAPAIQDAHPSNSDPLDEQTFVVNMINLLQQSPEWKSTAVIIAYDDSDGWYDHMNNVINPSSSAQDSLIGPQQCAPLPGTSGALATPLPGINGQPVNGRCGYGPRQPLLVISPFAKPNFVDHTLTDQSSIIRFVEDNWLNSQRIGQGSYDSIANPITNMLDFNQTPNPKLVLNASLGTKQ
ncbi:alkaline phosphatase family protein [Bradyrhizobium sp. dw_78]|uniref:phospholipase C n=1 Tax=Bradyrhizobium sp. dw_78 TaxID=2719793 RepID=UPI001BD234B8|nr:alkaline phosphatase family protein [Bradyrhizobium sp. dw_78]